MSHSLAFRHQNYWNVPDNDSYELIVPPRPIAPGSSEFLAATTAARTAFDSFRVGKIVLVHGTLAGTDALGWYGHWQRVIPGMSKKLKQVYKSVVDKLARDRGNYSATYAELLEKSLNPGPAPPVIKVELFDWTSENHHLGRADAAVRLADQLLDARANGERVLLWGHSHAGNVFALVTHLLGNQDCSEPEMIERFFSAMRPFNPFTRRIDYPAWKRLQSRLQNRLPIQGQQTKPSRRLDIVTFGTPVRYGWDESGCDNLLHFVNHHPLDHVAPYRSVWPKTASELIAAIRGDYGDFIQQTFVAQSDLSPAFWSWTAWKSNRILRNLLEASEQYNNRLQRLRQAVRVADSGFTCLVDYAAVDPSAREVFGHAVYTDLDWMAFHLKEICARLYVS